MGMTLSYRNVSARAFAAMIENEKLVEHVVAYSGADDGIPAELKAMMAKLPPEMAPLMLEQFQKQMSDPALGAFFAKRGDEAKTAITAAGLGPDDFGETMTIEKAWHGLHVALGGTGFEPGPGAAAAVLGGKSVGADLGYGPARVLAPAEVAALAGALAAVADDDLRTPATIERLTREKAYAVRTPSEADLDWIVDAFHDVRAYFARAAERGDAMLVAMR